MALGPFQFGLNISSMNPVSDILKDFIFNDTFLFKRYHDGNDLFTTMEGYLQGNETMFENRMHEMESIRSRYLECRFNFDYTCIDEIEKKRAERQKEIMERFNMTLDDYIPFVRNKLKTNREKLEGKRSMLVEGKQKVLKGTNLV